MLADFQDLLDTESSWRVKEIANLKSTVRTAMPLGERTLIRAGVPLLYAHWEGFIKAASLGYMEYVNNQRLTFAELSACFVALGAKRHLASLRTTRKTELNVAAVEFFLHSMGERANLSLARAVDTESNLNSEVFENIALSVGVDPAPYRPRFNLIDESLLRRRNRIAHGEYLDLNGGEFRDLADEVLALIRTYKNDLENAATLRGYRR